MNAIPINYLAVLVAAIIRIAVGFAWYSPSPRIRVCPSVRSIFPMETFPPASRAVIVAA